MNINEYFSNRAFFLVICFSNLPIQLKLRLLSNCPSLHYKNGVFDKPLKWNCYTYYITTYQYFEIHRSVYF